MKWIKSGRNQVSLKQVFPLLVLVLFFFDIKNGLGGQNKAKFK